MIPKIICFIFGHKRYQKEINRVRATQDPYTYIKDIIRTKLPECPRCGANL